MKIVITGAAGFVGRKLAGRILESESLAVDGENRPIDRVVLFDIARPAALPDDGRVEVVTGDITDGALLRRLIAGDGSEPADLVFHLAAIVSADAEADFEKGMSVNFDGTRAVLEAARSGGHRPRLVFASSVAVYGGPVIQETIEDGTHLAPQTSYGAQKAMGELMVGEYHRKGFIDGSALRLPTIVVRAGKPNKAASTFASSIMREPLAGSSAVCPVAPSARMFFMAPRTVVSCFIHAAKLESDALGQERSLQLAGLTLSMEEMVASLERVAGKTAAERIDWQPDPVIQRIVSGWATDFVAERAAALGFPEDRDFDQILRDHVEDELGGRIAA
ncbi:MAG: D-erythronate dehydrogenase [Geminicoccaceae bacterium]